jgi:TetR/AcrR family transcriptional regulator, regulator of cefoperazone and chloramphenicol sensitivity
MKTTGSKREETGDRIIAAAGAVFAERGFRGTTIRQITARAGVNLAAVHYHFRDKGELYVRVLREAKRRVSWIVIRDLAGTPEERLRGFIDLFVHYLLDPERPSWHGRVLAMEMANPTPALGIVIKELTAPLYRDVRALIGEVAEGKLSPAELDLFALSIFGQCVFYVSSRPIVEKLALDLGRTSDQIEQISAHIGNFSLAALRNFHHGLALPAIRTSRARSHRLSLP